MELLMIIPCVAFGLALSRIINHVGEAMNYVNPIQRRFDMKLENIKTVIQTPWGIAQRFRAIAPGITYYSTHCHACYYLSPEFNAKISAEVKETTWLQLGFYGWYEEDDDGAIVKQTFPEYFKTRRFIQQTAC